jgi:3-oxoacyl-[acyl-carrier protein] reductase
MQLKNKTAVITGCNRGIGLSILENFSKNGANVIACVRKNSEEFKTEVENFSKKYGNKINVVSFDLEKENEIDEGFIKIKKITKEIDILVNNAGINQMSLFQMTTLKTFRSVFEINFFSIVNFTQKILKLLKKNNFSKIINISSNAAILSDAGRAAYSPSKAALISFTEVLSKELSNYKINVNAIAPGLVNTDMMKNTPQKVIEEALKNTPLSKAAEPNDVANTSLFLASDQSNHITGETIFITGGM